MDIRSNRRGFALEAETKGLVPGVLFKSPLPSQADLAPEVLKPVDEWLWSTNGEHGAGCYNGSGQCIYNDFHGWATVLHKESSPTLAEIKDRLAAPKSSKKKTHDLVPNVAQLNGRRISDPQDKLKGIVLQLEAAALAGHHNARFSRILYKKEDLQQLNNIIRETEVYQEHPTGHELLYDIEEGLDSIYVYW